jgi:hypothetical protein
MFCDFAVSKNSKGSVRSKMLCVKCIEERLATRQCVAEE